MALVVKNILRKATKGLLFITAVLFVAATVLFFYLNSDSGRQALVSWANDTLSDENGGVRLTGLEGSLFSDFTLLRLEISDQDGVWLSARGINADWSPLSLFSGDLTINSTALQEIDLIRLPKTTAAQGRTETGEEGELTFDLPETPFDIVIGKFTAETITVGAGVVGFPARFTGTGKLDYAGEAGVILAADLLSLSKVKDRISLDISYPDEDASLKADLLIFAPQGSMWGTLAGIDARYDMMIDFKGRGPIDDWQGQLNAQVGDVTIAEATIVVDGQALSLNAALDAGEYLSDEETALFGSTASLDVNIRPSDQASRKHLSLELVAETAKLDVSGIFSTRELNISESLDFSLEIIDVAPFAQLTAPIGFDRFAVNGSIANVTSRPKVTFQFADAVALSVEDISASVSGVFDVLIDQSRIDVSANGALTGLEGATIETYKPLADTGVNWAVSGAYEVDTLTAEIREFRLENKQLDVTASGTLADGFQVVNAAASATVNQLQSIQTEIKGRAALDVRLDQASRADDMNISLRLAGSDLDFDDPALNQLVGAEPVLTSTLIRGTGGAIKLSDVQLNTAHVAASGKGNLSPENIINDGVFTVRFNDLDAVAPVAGVQLDGNVDVGVEVNGPLSSPSIKLETDLNRLDLQSIEFQDLVLEAALSDLLTKPTGQINIAGRSSIGPVVGEASIASGDGGLVFVPTITFDMGEYAATGNLEIPKNAPVTGTVKVVTQTAGDAGSSRYGLINGQIGLSDQSGVQQVDIAGRVKNIRMPVGKTDLLMIGDGAINASMRLLKNTFDIAGEIALEEVSHPRAQALKITARAERRDGVTGYQVDAIGSRLMPYDLKASGRVLEQAGAQVIELDLSGTIADRPAGTQQPIILRLAGDGFIVEPFALVIGDGSIAGEAIASQGNKVAATVEIKNINTAIARTFIPEIPVTGTIDARGQLSIGHTRTSRDSPLGSFTLKVTDLYAVGNALPVDQGVEMIVNGALKPDGINITGTASLPSIVDADFNGAFPLTLDETDMTFSLATDRQLSGEVAWRGNIGLFWPILGLVNHDLTGKIDADLRLGGTYDSPDIDGYVRINGGRYENAQSGFVAADILLRATVTDRQLVIDKLSATDGSDGTVSADGYIKLDKNFRYEGEASLSLNKARLVRKPNLGIKASSALKFVTNNAASSLSGEVTVDSASIGAIERGEADVIELDVREINGSHADGAESVVMTASGRPVDLNVHFRVPNQLYIRSYGMDSEWSSDIKITGTSLTPLVSGTATLERGTFDFSGKRFNLTRGNLTFTGERKIDPLLDISAENQLPDLTAILTITGRASAPRIEVSSSPSFPEDEVLSRVFFGTSVADLSPVEAVQLAATIHALSTGGEQGLVGGIRRSLGIDRLSIGQADSRDYGTTITGGKYLTNNIYVEVTTAPATGETATAVEVGLTKNLSLITRRTLDHDNNLAIRWSWNY